MSLSGVSRALGLGLLCLAPSCSRAESPERAAPAREHLRLLEGYARSSPLPSGPWKGIGESSPKRLALVARERELLVEARENPTPLTHRMLGSLYTTVGETSRGLAYLADSLVRDPSDSEAWTWLGANRLDRGVLDEARTLLEHAVQLDPADTHALTFLGIARARAGDVGGARESFEDAVRIDPEHVDALVSLAGLLEDGGELELARERLLVADRVRPNDAPTLFRLARIADELGLAQEAREYEHRHERVRVLDDLGLLYESIPEAQRRASLGIHFLESGRAADALPEFEAALELEPEPNVRLNALLGRAWSLVQLERVDEARAAIAGLRGLQPEHVELARLEAALAELRAVDR